MTYRVGAVAYHPRVVTIWEDFRRWFAEQGFGLDYTLYSTYEAQVERLRAGELDACVVSSWTLKAMREARDDEGPAVAWTSHPFHHCTFTRLDSSTASHDAFHALLVSMDAADPALSEAMRLENVNRWVDGEDAGYVDLAEAVRWRGA